jgi:hypothetical protein
VRILKGDLRMGLGFQRFVDSVHRLPCTAFSGVARDRASELDNHPVCDLYRCSLAHRFRLSCRHSGRDRDQACGKDSQCVPMKRIAHAVSAAIIPVHVSVF